MEVTFPPGCKGYAGAEIPPGLVPQHRPRSSGWANAQCSTHTSEYSGICTPAPRGGSRAPEVILHPMSRSGEQSEGGSADAACSLL